MDKKHLKRRGQTWYVRVRVPPALQALLRKTEIVRSLKTQSLKEAQDRRYQAVAEIKAYLSRVRESGTLDPLSTPGGILAAAKAAKVSVDAGQMSLAQVQAEWSTAVNMFFDDGTDRPEIPSASTHALAVARRVITGTDTELLSYCIRRHLEEIAPRVMNQSLHSREKRLNGLMSFTGDLEIGQITRKQLGSYVSGVVMLSGKSIGTMKGVVSEITTFFNWSLERGLIDLSPATRLGASIRESKRGTRAKVEGKRRPWSAVELCSLIDRVAQELGEDAPLYAMVCVAAYSGLRAEEIATLTVADVEGGCFHINQGKSNAAVREVPVHSEIDELVSRLIGYRISGWLIPGMVSGGPDGKRSNNLLKAFGRYIRKWGYTDKRLCFHSLRKSFATQLEETGSPDNVTRQLLGHAKEGMSYGLYSAGVSVEVLRSAVEKVKYRE